jgi:hypothetical protein
MPGVVIFESGFESTRFANEGGHSDSWLYYYNGFSLSKFLNAIEEFEELGSFLKNPKEEWELFTYSER